MIEEIAEDLQEPIMLLEQSTESNCGSLPSSKKNGNITCRHFKASILLVASLLLGIIKTLPLAILIPESLSLGLSISQATLIVSSWPAACVLVFLIQPFCNRLPDTIYLISSGVLCAGGYFSFYFSVQTPDMYLYIAIVALFLAGLAQALIGSQR